MSDGWKVRVTTVDGSGRPAIFRDYLVFEADEDRAIALARLHMTINDGETIELRARVARNELLKQGMKSGDVKLM
jgi:hypothetical protein